MGKAYEAKPKREQLEGSTNVKHKRHSELGVEGEEVSRSARASCVHVNAVFIQLLIV
jgi:hypothetical protein